MNKEEYKDLINIWSKIYKKKLGDLFSLEELKQQAWLGLLEAEQSLKNKKSDDTYGCLAKGIRQGYLSQGIKNHIITMLIQEIKNKASNTSIILADTDNPETIIGSKQLIENLKLRIEKIPHANFILEHMNSKSVRDISKIAKSEGINISKSAVANKIILIKEELNKILSI
jgi:hypothetical protein